MKRCTQQLIGLAIVTCSFLCFNRTEFAIIHFQDHFQNDTIGISIDSLNLVDNLVLSSDRVLGFTGLVVTLSLEEAENSQFVVANIEGAKKIEISSLNLEDLRIYVKINGERFLISRKIANGKYLGVNKSERDCTADCELYISQSKNPFEYE